MTNRTNAQIDILAERCIDLYYDDDIIDLATATTFIEEAGFTDHTPSFRDNLAHSIAFDIDDLLHNGNGEDLFGDDADDAFIASLSSDDLDRLTDCIADKLIARF